ncbi:MAG TPA: BMP family ABC transporter substrate-binding protein [Devosiaceae bacterium]|jgi:basic membrane protein A
MTGTTFARRFAGRASVLAGGIALSALMAGTALADPAIIYDLGGKFDKSFNEAGFNGATQWAKETGGHFQDLELQNDAQREQALRRFAASDFSPIVLPGFNWASALAKISGEFPGTDFVIIDDDSVNSPNVKTITFKAEDGSYLAGVLAALKSTTGKVGFVGGMDIPLIHDFFCGYKQGVMATNPDAEVFENYIGTTPAAWNDPVAAGELTKADFDRGADIVYAAAGGSGLGVLQAAKDAGKLGIGVDSNQNYLQPGSVLTSVLKRVDVAVYDAFKNADKFQGGHEVLGLAEDGVGLAMDDNNKPLITDAMTKAIDDAKAKIVAGDIKVHKYSSDSSCP